MHQHSSTPIAFLAFFVVGGYSFVVTSKIDLPTPPGIDSSLSPKLVRAFYEINFVPVDSVGIHSKIGEAKIQEKTKDCEYSQEFCKYFHFVPTKVSTVQKVEDMIQSALSKGEVPVVGGYGATDAQVSDILNEINQTVNKVVPVKGQGPRNSTATKGDVPVYLGVVNTQAVLERTERPEVINHQRPSNNHHHQAWPAQVPARLYYPPGRPYYNEWRENPCLRSPCSPPWQQPIYIDSKIQ